MLIEIPFNLEIISMTSFVISSLLVLIVLRQGFKIRRLRKQQQTFDTQLTSLSEAIANQRSYTHAFLKRIQTLDDELHKITEHQQDIEESIENSSAYKQALKMVEMGASIEDIVTNCDLGLAEAKLLYSLHGSKTSLAECSASA